jgi:hypothetical protein
MQQIVDLLMTFVLLMMKMKTTIALEIVEIFQQLYSQLRTQRELLLQLLYFVFLQLEGPRMTKLLTIELAEHVLSDPSQNSSTRLKF